MWVFRRTIPSVLIIWILYVVDTFIRFAFLDFTLIHGKNGIFGRHQFGMWQNIRQIQKERFRLIINDKLQRFFLYQILSISFGFTPLISGQHHFLLIMPQMIRIIVMSLTLAIIPEELIESEIGWITL